VRRISEGGCDSPSGLGEVFECFLRFSMLVTNTLYTVQFRRRGILVQ